MHAAEEVKRLKDKVCKLSDQSEKVDTELHSDLLTIMNESTATVKKTYAEGSFARLLWDELNVCYVRASMLIKIINIHTCKKNVRIHMLYS